MAKQNKFNQNVLKRNLLDAKNKSKQLWLKSIFSQIKSHQIEDMRIPKDNVNTNDHINISKYRTSVRFIEYHLWHYDFKKIIKWSNVTAFVYERHDKSKHIRNENILDFFLRECFFYFTYISQITILKSKVNDYIFLPSIVAYSVYYLKHFILLLRKYLCHPRLFLCYHLLR